MRLEKCRELFRARRWAPLLYAAGVGPSYSMCSRTKEAGLFLRTQTSYDPIEANSTRKHWGKILLSSRALKNHVLLFRHLDFLLSFTQCHKFGNEVYYGFNSKFDESGLHPSFCVSVSRPSYVPVFQTLKGWRGFFLVGVLGNEEVYRKCSG